MAYYAYSPIHHDDKIVARGESVSQKELGVDDETWAVWIQDNVIGENKLPKDIRSTESLTEYNRRRLAAMVAKAEAGDLSAFDQASDEEPIAKTDAKEVG